MKRKFKILFAAILAAACAAYAGWSATRPLTVNAEVLVLGALREEYTVQGEILPESSVVLNAGESGVVSSLPFKIGMEIKAGEPVAVLAAGDNTETELRLAQMRQSLSLARREYDARYGDKGTVEAKLELARNEYDAAQWDYQAALRVNEGLPGTYSEAEMNLRQNALTIAEQNLALAQNDASAAARAYYREQISSWESQVAALEKTLGAEPVPAPYDGVLWEVYAEEGDYVNQYQPLAKVYRAGEMKVEALVLTEDAARMRLGDTARCTLADGGVFMAEITYISPVAGKVLSAIGIEENRNIVELSPEALPAFAGAGHEADIRFTDVAAENILTAPVSALVPLPAGGEGVYLIRDGRAVLQPVVTGKKSGGFTELVSGAAEGDVLILNPFDTAVKEGARAEGEFTEGSR